MPVARESSGPRRTPVSHVNVTDNPLADLAGLLHKEARLLLYKPTISFNSKWLRAVEPSRCAVRALSPVLLKVISYANKCKQLGIL